MTWLIENLGTIVVSLILIVVLAGITAGMVKRRRKGISSCGCKCGSCPMSGTCHKPKITS